MMRTLLIIIALIASVLVANGNPIAVPPHPHPITIFQLAAEDVVIAVDASESRVNGKYTFTTKTVESYEPFARDGASIAIPVILPASGTERDWLDSAKLKATIDTHACADFSVMPERKETFAVQPQLPAGWKLVFFFIGQAAGHGTLKVQISYTQPHLPGNVAAYLPILPDNIVKRNYLVTFRAQHGTMLTPAAKYDVVGQPTDTILSVRPSNLQLLKAQVAQLGQ